MSAFRKAGLEVIEAILSTPETASEVQSMTAAFGSPPPDLVEQKLRWLLSSERFSCARQVVLNQTADFGKDRGSRGFALDPDGGEVGARSAEIP